MKKEILRYSEAFKLQVVSELESGKFKCIFEARKRYGIRTHVSAKALAVNEETEGGSRVTRGWLIRAAKPPHRPISARLSSRDSGTHVPMDMETAECK